MSEGKDKTLGNVVKVDFLNHARKSAADTKPADNSQNFSKREKFEQWIKSGTVSVLFDARKSDVKVPEMYKSCGDLRLNFCHKFNVPDFDFNDVGVWATLSFDNGEHFCMVPWAHVFALQSPDINQGAVWFDDFPDDYDQMAVLGFSEEMCYAGEVEISDSLKPEHETKCDVIKLDSARERNIVDS